MLTPTDALDLLRRLPREQVPQFGLSILPLHNRAVVDDEGERNRKEVGNRLRKMKAAPRDERNFDSARRRLDERLAVRIR